MNASRGPSRTGARRAARLGALAAILGALLCAGPALALDPRPAPRTAPGPIQFANLAGIWRLDWSRSDARPRIDGSSDFGRPRGDGAGRDPDGENAGRGRSGTGARSRTPAEGSDRTVLEWARTRLTVQTLIIFQDGERVEMSENGRRVERVDLDGAEGRARAPGPAPESRRGRWEKSNLVTTSDLEGGGTLTETFRLASDGLSLDVAARLQRGPFGPPIVMHRVYKRYPGA